MVKETTVTTEPETRFGCDGCWMTYPTREGAEKCESQTPDRIYVSGRGKDWRVGDIALAHVHCGKNTGYRLVEIDYEYESHHTVRPFLVPIDDLGPLPIREIGEKDIDDEDWGDYTPMHMMTMNIRVFNEKWTKQFLTIADKLQSLESKTRDE